MEGKYEIIISPLSFYNNKMRDVNEIIKSS